MNTHRTHNPVLEQRLRNFIVRSDAEGLSGCLKELSNADFRTSGILLRECLLTELQGEDFWIFFLTIVPTNSRAYLGTFLKAAAVLYEYDSISLASPALDTFAAQASAVDRQKVMLAFLPHVRRVGDAERLFELFTDNTPRARISYLLPIATDVASYLLFQGMRHIDHQPETLRSVCISLMKRGDHRAFALASILKAYFGLSDLPGTFSLQLEPFQLSRLETSYESFCKILKN